ncbi:uncharacterized protein BJ171DRAFT_229045 [Polychytrium aggregatum]|uniref:uncharacterized protein n=1 Tax=Polychytrium aggregatum TaxID=110093 RepID=UPI0022FF2A86|nr:uncharacterized protein BJ171DRAFT_229045 [Polychytrium aggregatum]KAI9197174.1 hypothetical protein BJ171DRAFT_229045 [Polychytrium aggregatum]
MTGGLNATWFATEATKQNRARTPLLFRSSLSLPGLSFLACSLSRRPTGVESVYLPVRIPALPHCPLARTVALALAHLTQCLIPVAAALLPWPPASCLTHSPGLSASPSLAPWVLDLPPFDPSGGRSPSFRHLHSAPLVEPAACFTCLLIVPVDHLNQWCICTPAIQFRIPVALRASRQCLDPMHIHSMCIARHATITVHLLFS